MRSKKKKLNRAKNYKFIMKKKIVLFRNISQRKYISRTFFIIEHFHYIGHICDIYIYLHLHYM